MAFYKYCTIAIFDSMKKLVEDGPKNSPGGHADLGLCKRLRKAWGQRSIMLVEVSA